METIIIPHSLLIQTDDAGAIISVQRQGKKAIFNGGVRVTPWELCDPEDVTFPLDSQALGEVNAGLLLQIEQLTASHAAEIAAMTSTPIPKTVEHPDDRKIWPNSAAFLAEFTMPELAAVELSTDPTIAALRLLLASWPADIYSDDPRIIGGLSALVAVGIITEARRGEILAK